MLPWFRGFVFCVSQKNLGGFAQTFSWFRKTNWGVSPKVFLDFKTIFQYFPKLFFQHFPVPFLACSFAFQNLALFTLPRERPPEQFPRGISLRDSPPPRISEACPVCWAASWFRGASQRSRSSVLWASCLPPRIGSRRPRGGQRWTDF